jgi:hypothetical protein
MFKLDGYGQVVVFKRVFDPRAVDRLAIAKERLGRAAWYISPSPKS